MTNALRLITEVKAVGGTVEIVPLDKLRVIGPADLVKQIRDNKPAIIEALLQTGHDLNDPDTYAFEERAAIIEADGVPRDWAEGFAKLCTMPIPAPYTQKRWEQILNDAGLFLDQWKKQLVALGWQLTDAFGVNPDAPEWRYDCMGLVLCLKGRSVVAIEEKMARIDCKDGASLTFYRQTLAPEAVEVWSLENLK